MLPITEGDTPPDLDVQAIDLDLPLEVRGLPAMEWALQVQVRESRLLTSPPWVRSLGKLALEVTTQGWRFPTPPSEKDEGGRMKDEPQTGNQPVHPSSFILHPSATRTRLMPTRDTVLFKDRLLYLLQPSLENLFAGRQLNLPSQPYPYQMRGIAFLMPREGALLADEMGLGKTAQSIIAMRLLFHGGLIQNALVICPKPLVINWTRELRMWGADVPFEVVSGDTEKRRAIWHVSNCPLKLVNYELLTRDAGLVLDEKVQFDLVILDEAQRIKSHDSKTAQVVRGVHRKRSWAMSGTPIENRPEDLINIFAFVDPHRIPPDTPVQRLPDLTADCILRRTKDDVLTDLPPKTIRDAFIELTPAQRAAYTLAEKEGVVRLNSLGDTISVQHVFELVMR
ncbi:MAG: DEAD/DEAH box helicase, partial [Planctomycetes bacterium]|nr:DEAD/DEAH box helicase [Planctomycetota bacterium]